MHDDLGSALFDALDNLGLDPQDRGKYYLIHCPVHEDKTKSAQCFKDGWIHCHAGCPRIHINQLSRKKIVPRDYSQTTEVQKPQCHDFTEFWLQFDPVDKDIKSVPAKELAKRGWRNFPGGWGMRAGILIPYFNVSRTKVIYFQIRHLEGERRFTFPRGARPATYGLEQLQYCKNYLVFTEGSRDSVILGMAGVPAVALPSASSKTALANMERYAKEHRLILVCAGDKDEAGERLISNISGPYIDARTPIGKDIGDLYEQEGLEGVKKYYEQYQEIGLAGSEQAGGASQATNGGQ